MSDFDLNDMVDFFSASGSGVTVAVVDEKGITVKMAEDDKKEKIVKRARELLLESEYLFEKAMEMAEEEINGNG